MSNVFTFTEGYSNTNVFNFVENSQPGINNVYNFVEGYSNTNIFNFNEDSILSQLVYTSDDSDVVFSCELETPPNNVYNFVEGYSNTNVYNFGDGKLYAQLAFTTDDVQVDFFAGLFGKVHRPTISDICTAADSASSATLKIESSTGQTKGIVSKLKSNRQTAAAQNIQLKSISGSTKKLQTQLCGTVDDAYLQTTKIESVAEQLTAAKTLICSDQDDTQPGNTKIEAPSDQLIQFNDNTLCSTVQDSGTALKRETKTIIDETGYSISNVYDFVEGYSNTNIFQFNSQPSTEFIVNEFVGVIGQCIDSTWGNAQPIFNKTCSDVEETKQPDPGISPWIDPPPPDPDPPDPEHETIVIPTQETYFMEHSFSVTLLDLTPVEFKSIDIEWNADAFAWSFSGSGLDKNHLPLLKQTGTTPVQIIATINGEVWKMVVDKITRKRVFGANSISVTGSGLSSLLGHPHSLSTSQTQGADLTVQQIADLQMPVGWSINWQASTWLVNGGAYSHQQRTPIQSIADIAGNIGAMIVPDRVNLVLKIMPRYPVLPWNFDTAAPDFIIPEDVITEVSEPSVIESPINGVYVHGQEIGGEMAFCRFNGTAGDRLANTVSNALMTDVVGLRALAERVLAGESTQPAIDSMTLPMGGVVPLIEPGAFIKTTFSGVDLFGVVNSITIHAEFGKTRQTIQIGEKTTNNWSLFKSLLPADPLLVGTLASTDGVTSVITLIDGGVVRVRGTGSANGKYYIRGGKIDSAAPDLVLSNVVI